MTRVLERASAIISLLGAHPDRALGLSTIARLSELSPATCSRLLKTLVRLGWIDQPGNRKGYRLGPRPFALVRGQPYRALELDEWLPLLHRLAESASATAVLSVLRHGRRQILYEVSTGGSIQRLDEHDDCYATASGRLLLAMLPRREQARIIDRLGLPDPRCWPGIIDRRELDEALAELRRSRRTELVTRPAGLATAATAVADGAGGWLALGVYHPRADRVGTLVEALAELLAPTP